MWELAKPLIEDWVESNLTPETRATEMVSEAGILIERLPNLIATLGESVVTIGRDGLRLHPDTAHTMSRRKSASRWGWWIGAAVVIGFLIVAN